MTVLRITFHLSQFHVFEPPNINTMPATPNSLKTEPNTSHLIYLRCWRLCLDLSLDITKYDLPKPHSSHFLSLKSQDFEPTIKQTSNQAQHTPSHIFDMFQILFTHKIPQLIISPFMPCLRITLSSLECSTCAPTAKQPSNQA